MINKSIKFCLALNAQEMLTIVSGWLVKRIPHQGSLGLSPHSAPHCSEAEKVTIVSLVKWEHSTRCVCVWGGAAPNLVSWRSLRVSCADFQTMSNPQPHLQSKERKAGVPLAIGNLGNSGQRAVVLSGGPRHSINVTWGLARDARSWATQSYGAPGQLSRCRCMC